MSDWFIALKAEVRQVVHDTLAASASLTSTDGTVYTTWIDPVSLVEKPITVRWHNRIARFGDMNDSGYSEVLEGVDRIILNTLQLDALGITPSHGWVVTPTNPLYQGASLTLNSMEPITGPVEQVWVVANNV